MTTQTTAAEEDAHHAELANQDEAEAIPKGEPMSLLKRLLARARSAAARWSWMTLL